MWDNLRRDDLRRLAGLTWFQKAHDREQFGRGLMSKSGLHKKAKKKRGRRRYKYNMQNMQNKKYIFMMTKQKSIY